ncbi:MAG: hypothetical protein LBJ59_09155 [Zoogloeaceae bacterium]|nr:hypothetical protein [Zoogloeaceae bacterium]
MRLNRMVFSVAAACFLLFFPFATWACRCAPPDKQKFYDQAYAIALVETTGKAMWEEAYNGYVSKVKVLQSWKNRLPESIHRKTNFG